MKVEVEYNLLQDGEETSKLSYDAILRETSDGKIYITYYENEIKNELLIDKRSKKINMTNRNVFEFEKNHIIDMKYKTDFGIIDMKVETSFLDIYFGDKIIYITIEYKLHHMGEIILNSMKISIKK